MSKFYDAFKKARTLGDDVVYPLYQVLRNRIDDLYANFEWVNQNTGAKLTNFGNPADIWNDLVAAFPNGAQIAPPLSPGEIAAFTLPPNEKVRISFKFGGNTNPNGHSFEFKLKSGYTYKIRCDL